VKTAKAFGWHDTKIDAVAHPEERRLAIMFWRTKTPRENRSTSPKKRSRKPRTPFSEESVSRLARSKRVTEQTADSRP
jgi:hypothetical protein